MRRQDRIDRKMLFRLAQCLYTSRTAKSPETGGVASVLLVRIDERVGNLVTLQSMLDALKEERPRLRVGLLASSRMTQITSALRGLDGLHQLDKRWFFRRPGLWHRAIAGVRREGYQVALDASAWHAFSFTHAALTYFSGAQVRVGYDRGMSTGFHTHLVKPGPEDEHELRQRMRLLAPLGIQREPPVLQTALGRGHEEYWDRWLADRGVGTPRVGVWPGSRKPERRWALDFFGRLGRRLHKRFGAGLVVLWGPGEERLRDALVAGIPASCVAAPPTDLPQLAGLMRSLDLVVTNDTGPMHLSVAVHTPTVALFASGRPSRWGHPYPYVVNLSAPGNHPEEVERVLDTCRPWLGRVCPR